MAVMIGNNDKSRPQYGLDQADMYVEAETEGGITRIMAVFANAARVPAQLGPVRSAGRPSRCWPSLWTRYTVTPVAARRGWPP